MIPSIISMIVMPIISAIWGERAAISKAIREEDADAAQRKIREASDRALLEQIAKARVRNKIKAKIKAEENKG